MIGLTAHVHIASLDAVVLVYRFGGSILTAES